MAMQNLNLPSKMQKEVINYLKITQEHQNGQKEFEQFFQALSPSLKNQVIQFIFREPVVKCEIFESQLVIAEFFIKSLQLLLLDPEYPLINQGEIGKKFYFIKNGELQVFVKHPVEKSEIFVKNMKEGQFFGEFSLITKLPRSASVRPKNYAMVGFLSQEKFEVLIFMYPEIGQRLKNHIQTTYEDKYRLWMKQQLGNIVYLKYLPDKAKNELILLLKHELFDENQDLFKQNEECKKLYILVKGRIEIYLSTSEGELIMDLLEEPGCILNMISVLEKYKTTFSARAKSDLECLTISEKEFSEFRGRNNMSSIRKLIQDFREKQLVPRKLNDRNERMYFLDYQRQSFVNGRGERMLMRGKREPLDIFRNAVFRCCMLVRYHTKKDNFLSDLIEELRKLNMDEEEKSKQKMKGVVMSVGKVVVQKMEKLIINRINSTNKDQATLVTQVEAI